MLQNIDTTIEITPVHQGWTVATIVFLVMGVMALASLIACGVYYSRLPNPSPRHKREAPLGLGSISFLILLFFYIFGMFSYGSTNPDATYEVVESEISNHFGEVSHFNVVEDGVITFTVGDSSYIATAPLKLDSWSIAKIGE